LDLFVPLALTVQQLLTSRLLDRVLESLADVTITRQTAQALTAFGYGILNLRSTRVVSCEAFSIYQVRDCGVTAKGRVLFATGETMTADYADHSQESGAAMC